MNNVTYRWFAIVLVLISLSLACSALGGGEAPATAAPTFAESQPTQPPAQTTEVPDIPTEPAEPAPTEPAEPAPTEPSEPPTPLPEQGPTEYDTNFPLPDDVQNFMKTDVQQEGINFQTSMSMEEVIAFYRQAFVAQGLVERKILTVIEEGKAFSMVFDGAPNGKATVIQGVALGEDFTNVNIRYEDV